MQKFTKTFNGVFNSNICCFHSPPAFHLGWIYDLKHVTFRTEPLPPRFFCQLKSSWFLFDPGVPAFNNIRRGAMALAMIKSVIQIFAAIRNVWNCSGSAEEGHSQLPMRQHGKVHRCTMYTALYSLQHFLKKHRKNCECSPVSLLIVMYQRFSWIQILNCQNCNQCQKS